MKTFVIAACFAALICFSGCSFIQELRNPQKRPQKTAEKTVRKPVSNEPEVLPDGTTYGLNPYEKQYINDIDQDFKRRQQLNSRKVFGGLTP
ncbi:MAG: hypothetical protein PHV82_12185 [Victivallaceae bacterium]|nr:hypothetical protein [Victivallaceae bacterium]